MDTMNKTKHSPLPWKIYGATVIWSPEGHANVAAVSDPHPPNDSSVGYYEIRPWTDNDAGKRFEEACANAELIVTAVNERERLRRMLSTVIDASYGTSYHHIGDGDGIPEAEAKEIADWWQAELEQIQREHNDQKGK